MPALRCVFLFFYLQIMIAQWFFRLLRWFLKSNRKIIFNNYECLQNTAYGVGVVFVVASYAR